MRFRTRNRRLGASELVVLGMLFVAAIVLLVFQLSQTPQPLSGG
jgi:hypothetical protein